MAMPSAPLCDSMPMVPAGGPCGANVASSDTAGSAFNTPIQFGPTMRIPVACRPHHGDRPGVEKAAHALRGGAALAAVGRLQKLLGLCRREPDVHDPGFDRAPHDEAAAREHAQHLVVLPEDVRFEFSKAVD